MVLPDAHTAYHPRITTLLLLLSGTLVAAMGCSRKERPEKFTLELGGSHGALEAASFSSDGTAFMAYGYGTLRVWDIARAIEGLHGASGEFHKAEATTYTVPRPRDGSASFSPDGGSLVIWVKGAAGPMSVWNTFTGQTRWRIEALTACVLALFFAPDGSALIAVMRSSKASGEAQGPRTLTAFDLATGAKKWETPLRSGESLSCLPGGKALATWADDGDGDVRLLDPMTGQPGTQDRLNAALPGSWWTLVRKAGGGVTLVECNIQNDRVRRSLDLPAGEPMAMAEGVVLLQREREAILCRPEGAHLIEAWRHKFHEGEGRVELGHALFSPTGKSVALAVKWRVEQDHSSQQGPWEERETWIHEETSCTVLAVDTGDEISASGCLKVPPAGHADLGDVKPLCFSPDSQLLAVQIELSDVEIIPAR
jgi:WD40 repeat protein